MGARSQPSSRSIAHPFHDTRDHLLFHRRRSGRAFRLAILMVVAWLALGTAPLDAQRNEREARGFVSSIAATIYNLAWPTAYYDGFELGEPLRMSRGYDVPILLYGRSGINDGRLWLELVVELRDGGLHDIRVRRHNAILAAPFSTITTMAAVVAAAAEEQRRAQAAQGTPQRAMAPPSSSQAAHDRRTAAALVGTWRDENSVYTFTSDGRWRSDWDTGSSATGSWTVRNGTLTWYFDSGTSAQYTLLQVGERAYQSRSLSDGRVWNSRRVRY